MFNSLVSSIIGKDKGKEKENDYEYENFQLTQNELRNRRLTYLMRKPNIKCYSKNVQYQMNKNRNIYQNVHQNISFPKMNKLTEKEIEEKEKQIEAGVEFIKKKLFQNTKIKYWQSGQWVPGIIVKNLSDGTMGTSNKQILVPYVHIKLKLENDDDIIIHSLEKIQLVTE